MAHYPLLPVRRFRFRLLVAGLAFALACGGDAPSVPGPNVIVVTIDTTRADAIGAYGQAKPTSPRIDALAAEGVLFEDVVTSAPSTLPSHATIFTGKQPYAHGVRSNAGYRLAEEHDTLADVLAARGYVTHAEIAAPVLGANKRLDQGFASYRDPESLRDPVEVLDSQRRFRQLTRPAEEITESGLDFVRAQRERPFLLWLHYFDPHKPYDPPAELAAELAPYHAEIRRVDRELGRLLDELGALGIRERTLVVVTSDHGEGQGQHNEETHSYFVYDSTMRVPLVFAGPGVPRGTRVRALARTVDITPTLLDLLGLPPLADVQGASLVPLFEDPTSNPNLIGYGESIEGALAFGTGVLRFVRVGRWKYIHKTNPELYDLRADPTEVRNRVAERPQTVRRLRTRLEELIAAAPAIEEARVVLDAEQLEELRALGYIAGDPGEVAATDLDSLELSGADPNDHIVDVQLYARGWGKLWTGEYDQALRAANDLLERDPSSQLGHELRVVAIERSGLEEGAIPALREAVVAAPDNAMYATALAAHLMRREEDDEAAALLRRAVELDACNVRARLLLSRIYESRARYAEQLALLEAGDPSCRDGGRVRNALAFFLATSPEASLRDGARALRLAREIVAFDSARHPGFVDTLAAACAEVGDFACAVAEQERAIALLDGRELSEEIRAIFQSHLEEYRAGRPVRFPPER